MENNTFEIDFFELSFLAEACIPPKPIARAMFWGNLINRYYRQMSPSERSMLYEWINKNWAFQKGLEEDNEECLLFNARFNPDNQYLLTVKYDSGEVKEFECFKWKNWYHLNKTTSILKEYIVDIKKIQKYE